MTEPAGFFQKHLILATSVALRLLLVLLFAIAMVIPRLSVEPPQHAMLVSVPFYQSGRQVKRESPTSPCWDTTTMNSSVKMAPGNSYAGKHRWIYPLENNDE
jgi:hypothetical protein